MIEVWKTIIDFPNYEISNLGNVRNIKTNKILKPFAPSGEYLKVSLSKNGKAKQFFIHRLVATAYIPNPDNLPEVNHIKEFEKTNNTVENLEWCDHSYNQNYGTRNDRIANYRKKKIKQYDLEGNFIKEWSSIKEVKEKLGYSCSAISACVIGRKKTSYGYVWIKAKESD